MGLWLVERERRWGGGRRGEEGEEVGRRKKRGRGGGQGKGVDEEEVGRMGRKRKRRGGGLGGRRQWEMVMLGLWFLLEAFVADWVVMVTTRM